MLICVKTNSCIKYRASTYVRYKIPVICLKYKPWIWTLTQLILISMKWSNKTTSTDNIGRCWSWKKRHQLMFLYFFFHEWDNKGKRHLEQDRFKAGSLQILANQGSILSLKFEVNTESYYSELLSFLRRNKQD